MLIRLNIIDREGKKTAIDIEEGTTIRDAIEEKLSPDNYGVCGGNCVCGTCHAHVIPSDFEKLKTAEEDEISTLKEEAIKSGLITEKEYKKIVDPKKMIGPY